MSSRKIYGPVPSSSLPVPPTAIVAATESVFPSAISAGTPILVSVPSGALANRAFDFIASGNITTTANCNATLKLYFVPSASVAGVTAGTAGLGSGTAIGTSGAIAQNTVSAPFLVRGRDFFFDVPSGKLTGKVDFVVNGTVVAAATLSATPAGLTATGDPLFALLPTVTLSAGGTATLQQCDVEF